MKPAGDIDMPHFNWDSTYSVKVKQFDDDHQELFRIINSLHDTLMARRGQEVLRERDRRTVAVLRQTFCRRRSGLAVQRRLSEVKAQTGATPPLYRQDQGTVKATYQEAGLGVTVDALDFPDRMASEAHPDMDMQYGDLLNAKGFARGCGFSIVREGEPGQLAGGPPSCFFPLARARLMSHPARLWPYCTLHVTLPCRRSISNWNSSSFIASSSSALRIRAPAP